MIRAWWPPLLVLVAYGLAFGGAAFGTSVIAFDDHPGQLYRLWLGVTQGLAPWTWNAGWWAGYPELQFYPPGFVYAGALLYGATLGALSIGGVYQLLVWLAWLAPGLTVWALLARLLGDGWLALPGAFLALTLSGGLASGVEGGVHIGMIAARLAWALLPVLVLALHDWSAGRRGVPLLAPLLLAAIVLTHPAHAPAAVVVLGLAATTAATRRGLRLGAAALVLVVGAALTGFWSVPLLARLAETRALAWGTFPVAEARDPAVIGLAILAALAGPFRSRDSEAVVARLPWAMLAVVAADAAVLEPLGLRWLPADRVVDGFWLGLVLAAGLVLGRGLRALVPPVPVLRPVAPGLVILAIAAAGTPGGLLQVWPRERPWTPWGPTVERLRLPELWTDLAGTPRGRILFLRSGIPLAGGDAWWRPHTHLTAVTPMVTGRAILGGTFTHPSPVAAAVYRGPTDRGPIRVLAERLDGQTSFGQPLDALDPVALTADLDRLGVSTVVALEADRPHLTALERDPGFARRPVPPPYVLYVRRRPVTLPEQVGPGRLRLAPGGTPGTWMSAGVAYYPLWRAEQDGKVVDARRGPLGDLEVRPSHAGAPVDLVYGPGPAEAAGVATTLAGVLALAALTIWRRRRARSADDPGGRRHAPPAAGDRRPRSPRTDRAARNSRTARSMPAGDAHVTAPRARTFRPGPAPMEATTTAWGHRGSGAPPPDVRHTSGS